MTDRPNPWAPARGQMTPIANISNPSFRKWEKPFTVQKSQAYITGRMQKFRTFGNLYSNLRSA